MNSLDSLFKIIIMLGIFLIIIGVVLFFLSRLGLTGFTLPGDIYIKKENFTFYFPLATSIFLSIILSVLINVFFRR